MGKLSKHEQAKAKNNNLNLFTKQQQCSIQYSESTQITQKTTTKYTHTTHKT